MEIGLSLRVIRHRCLVIGAFLCLVLVVLVAMENRSERLELLEREKAFESEEVGSYALNPVSDAPDGNHAGGTMGVSDGNGMIAPDGNHAGGTTGAPDGNGTTAPDGNYAEGTVGVSDGNGTIAPDGNHAGGTEGVSDETTTEKQTVQLPQSGVEGQLTLLVVGDVILHEKVIRSGLQADGSYCYDHLYADLREEIAAVDLAVLNQETVLGGENYPYSGYPKFNSPTEIGDAAVAAGFDVVLHANNHITDMGIDGLLDTLKYWRGQPDMLLLGIQETREEYAQVAILERNGIRLALLNYTYGLNVGTSGHYYMVDSLTEDKVRQDVAFAKKNADFIIVFPHWGTEYSLTADEQQATWTELFCTLGVDLVIGAHPHVVQPVTWVSGADGHRMLVYYSLGNYVSSMDFTDQMLGAMATVTLVRENDSVIIREAKVTPIVTHYEQGGDNGFRVLRLTDYTETLARRHYILADERGADFSLDRLWEIANTVLGDAQNGLCAE